MSRDKRRYLISEEQFNQRYYQSYRTAIGERAVRQRFPITRRFAGYGRYRKPAAP